MIVLLFSYWDILIRLRMIINIRAARRSLEAMSVNISRMIFATGRLSVGMRIIDESEHAAPLPERFLLIVNHQSLLDIPLIILYLKRHRLRFVGKRELFRHILLISVVFRTMRHGCIDRHRDFANTVRELTRLARQAKREGHSLVVFPEGTRAKQGDLLPFHSGAFRTILRTSPMPVVIAALNGGYRASRMRDLREGIRGLTYRVKILSIRPAPQSKDEMQFLLEEARAEINAKVAEWRKEEADSRPTPPSLGPRK